MFETLAASVIAKDSKEIFKTESIKGIIEYKYQEHKPMLYLLLAVKTVYLLIVYFLSQYNQRHTWILQLFAILKVVTIIL